MRLLRFLFHFPALIPLFLFCNTIVAQESVQQLAEEITRGSGISGGVIVHVGCGDGRLTAALRTSENVIVHGLGTAEDVVKARKRIVEAGGYGPVSFDRLPDDGSLPYVDNTINAVISENLGVVPMTEVMRVLCPNGIAYIRTDGMWQQTIKPRPDTIGEWTHYLQDATNNAVAQDTEIAPPRHLQWIGSPRWSRHHDRLASLSALVSAGGRIFYIFDQGSTASVLLPSHWALIARDAFNGTLLWHRDIPLWQTQLWSLKSGPAQLPRRLVATPDAVYVTLGIDAPVTALDARTGKTLVTFSETKGAEEIMVSEGILFAVVPEKPNLEKYTAPAAVNKPWWNGESAKIVALHPTSGACLWEYRSPVLPMTLTIGDKRVFFHDGEKIVCLDHSKGTPLWSSVPIPRIIRLMSFFAPTLLVQDDVVLFAGGEESGRVKSTGGATKSDTLTALDAPSGKVLWTAEHPPSGYSSPEDLFVINDLVWSGAVSNGKFSGAFAGRDLHTGEIKYSSEADVETYWFHHRCYRGKATERFIMTSRTGIEFIDPITGHWDINHWVRGGCMYGIMPANGLIYTPPHDCICYPESKLFGLNALAPASPSRRIPKKLQTRLEKGPAFGQTEGSKPINTDEEWPTYRGNMARGGQLRADIAGADSLQECWTADLGTHALSALVIAGGVVYIADTNAHTIKALDANTGTLNWAYTAGGRIDSPPTIYAGLALFGSADGWIYALRATDGTLAWRFRAAPVDRRLEAFEQLESIWPVSGSVLVHEGVLFAVAGRSMFLDEGLRFLKLNPVTGELLNEIVLDERDPTDGENLQKHVKWLNMPVALPDILATDGTSIFMRSQRFDLDGNRLRIPPKSKDRFDMGMDQQGEGHHLFSPIGFLDGSWFHRAYWMYGRTFGGGWNGYFVNGNFAPAGKIMVMDQRNVYTFGRKPKYYRWTTSLEHQLFAAPKNPPSVSKEELKGAGAAVWVQNSASLDPTGKALTVSAWVKPTGKPSGVIVSRGGPIHGYALTLRKGRPEFSIRADTKLDSVIAKKTIAATWTHLAGILTTDLKAQLWVNGTMVAEAGVKQLIPKAPAQATQIGIDDQGAVGDYSVPFPFSGLIDDVRVYHRALTREELQVLTTDGGEGSSAGADLVLHLPFDDGKGTDTSGNENHGRVDKATPAAGKIGGALRFKGKQGGTDYFVEHNWTHDVPILVRGMVLAGQTDPVLFIAGPPDLLDEDKALREYTKERIQEQVLQQEQSLLGAKGAMLMAVSAVTGDTLSEYPLSSPPVWDGMAAAGGRIFIATMSGKVVCMEGK